MVGGGWGGGGGGGGGGISLVVANRVVPKPIVPILKITSCQ